MPKIKNIIIFVAIGIVLTSVYVLLIKKNDAPSALVTTSATTTAPATATGTVTQTKDITKNSQIAKDFLTLLLNVKSISLNDSIFSDIAFEHLKDSSILLIQEGKEGRPNPFAPLGVDVMPETTSMTKTLETFTTPVKTNALPSVPSSAKPATSGKQSMLEDALDQELKMTADANVAEINPN